MRVHYCTIYLNLQIDYIINATFSLRPNAARASLIPTNCNPYFCPNHRYTFVRHEERMWLSYGSKNDVVIILGGSAREPPPSLSKYLDGEADVFDYVSQLATLSIEAFLHTKFS